MNWNTVSVCQDMHPIRALESLKTLIPQQGIIWEYKNSTWRDYFAEDEWNREGSYGQLFYVRISFEHSLVDIWRSNMRDTAKIGITQWRLVRFFK